MGQVDLSDYKTLYIQTAREYIGKISASLDQLSNDVLDKEALNSLHIASHSLRSQSQVMGFADIANICLSIERMADDALKGTIQLNNESIPEIKKSVAKLTEILKLIQDDTGAKVWRY